jgi:hypothetical protein
MLKQLVRQLFYVEFPDLDHLDYPEDAGWLDRLSGYFLVPHELLHVLALRCMGRKWSYRLGNIYVRVMEPVMGSWPLPFWEQLCFLWTPVVVIGGSAALLFVVWSVTFFIYAASPPETYLLVAPWWHKLLTLALVLTGAYTVTTEWDVAAGLRVIEDALSARARRNEQDSPEGRGDQAE